MLRCRVLLVWSGGRLERSVGSGVLPRVMRYASCGSGAAAACLCTTTHGPAPPNATALSSPEITAEQVELHHCCIEPSVPTSSKLGRACQGGNKQGLGRAGWAPSARNSEQLSERCALAPLDPSPISPCLVSGATTLGGKKLGLGCDGQVPYSGSRSTVAESDAAISLPLLSTKSHYAVLMLHRRGRGLSMQSSSSCREPTRTPRSAGRRRAARPAPTCPGGSA